MLDVVGHVIPAIDGVADLVGVEDAVAHAELVSPVYVRVRIRKRAPHTVPCSESGPRPGKIRKRFLANDNDIAIVSVYRRAAPAVEAKRVHMSFRARMRTYDLPIDAKNVIYAPDLAVRCRTARHSGQLRLNESFQRPYGTVRYLYPVNGLSTVPYGTKPWFLYRYGTGTTVSARYGTGTVRCRTVRYRNHSLRTIRYSTVRY